MITSNQGLNPLALLILVVAVSLILAFLFQIANLKSKKQELTNVINKIEEGRQSKMFYHTHHRLLSDLEITHQKEKDKKIPSKEDRIKLIKGKR